MLNSPPVIIFGNPRSGTRMCATVLNVHPDICITDEFYNVEMLLNLANRQISSFLSKRVDEDSIPLRKELLVKNYWTLRCTFDQIEKSHKAVIIGNKTPRAEKHYQTYEEIFSINKPIYIYCARNAYDVLRSIKNLKNIQWNKLPFKDLFENYKNSYRIYTEIKEKYPDRIIFINVDKLDKLQPFEVYRPIFDILKLKYNADFIECINRISPQNTLEKVKKVIKDSSPVEELTVDEEEFISNCHEYKKIEDQFLESENS
ncbi:sulfotransferase [Microbulbifer variabilis]|uniref:Sulfotransferase n=1 Tax=Microbulbifer variabilis TaxID=266805 RepID=A0ABY4VDL3_9GAMM|nr:sulfotransferase [Microbulbifer variabilis]USD22390.1 sulfotransferase [Microbulbifer variabilis]